MGINISAYLHDLILYQYLFQIALHDLFTTLFCRLFVNGLLSASTIDLVLNKISFQIILTVAEHHSAIVPWQLVAQKTGAVLKYVELNEHEVPDVDKLKDMLSRKTKLVVVHHVSNVLGMFLISCFLSFFIYYAHSCFV